MEVQREQFPQVLRFLQGDILATQSLSDKKTCTFVTSNQQVSW